MIIIASDKFKGTLSSLEAGEAISKGLSGLQADIAVVPMADGGEGTAQALMANAKEGLYYEFSDYDRATCAYVPSCGEGLSWQDEAMDLSAPVWMRLTTALGRAIVKASRSGRYARIYVGIGGTKSADAGLGMLAEIARAGIYTDNIVGLADVAAPLYADEGLSAMSFLRQKGATDADMEYCKHFFRAMTRRYGSERDVHGGAGGGIGYALESILGCKVIDGAPYLFDLTTRSLPIPSLLITGEGRIDAQTLGGKTVGAVYSYGRRLRIPVVSFCGSMAGGTSLPFAYACVEDGSPVPLKPVEALENCAREALPQIEKLLGK